MTSLSLSKFLVFCVFLGRCARFKYSNSDAKTSIDRYTTETSKLAALQLFWQRSAALAMFGIFHSSPLDIHDIDFQKAQNGVLSDKPMRLTRAILIVQPCWIFSYVIVFERQTLLEYLF